MKKSTSKPHPWLSGLKALAARRIIRHANTRKAEIALQLATLAETMPRTEGWIFEAKYDGYRILAIKRGTVLKLISRNGLDWTHRFANVAEALLQVDSEDFILDGEIVIFDRRGKSSFAELQKALSTGVSRRFTYVVFDVLRLERYDLRPLPLLARKRLLESLSSQFPTEDLNLSPVVEKNPKTFFARIKKRGLEGVIAKRAQSPYRSGRSEDWLKIKASFEEEFLIAGYTEPEGSRAGFGALLLAYHDDKGQLIYSGRVGTGFDESDLKQIYKWLRRHPRKSSPFANKLHPLERRGVHFVKAGLVAQIRYANWTTDARLRQAVFLGLREDKLTGQVKRPAANISPHVPRNLER
ncbi:MAG TPA: non-homologous end-joining DNA ligase [Bdellovibrionota bacterium]|nr:non-homologous end-joining DNA ligase [Bdellovibrionota bacterium]